ncbi:MAG: hypothetical protein J6A88_04255 [Oscillospiraceae bacterium]|nr:hypothetical protein [Oscillospiraceae bacterium]
MQSTVEKILRKYGREITVERGEESLVFQGFFHHTGSKDWHNMEKAYTVLGQIPRGQYLVMAPTWIKLAMGDRICCDGKRYSVRRVEGETFQEERIYSWALCVELGKEDTWPI